LAALAAATLSWSALAQEPSTDTTTPKKHSSKSGSAASMDEKLQAAVDEAYGRYKGLSDGKNADYIPALAKVDSNLFGIVVITVDGKVYSAGDIDHLFSIQSVSKPFVFARLLTEQGPEAAEKKLGVNATGQAFNSITAIEQNKQNKSPPPGNPLVNAGAISTVALLQANGPIDRWHTVSETLNRFAGRKLLVDEEIYKSESETNTRNKSIAELLKAYEVIPGNAMEALDVYTRQCSVAVNTKDLAAMGATLANGGLNPISGQKVVSPEIASEVLAVMQTAGLYETSGDWAFRVGAPAKSGVGGGIVAVVPGKFAVAAFSPPLDKAGNSVRAQKAIEFIVRATGANLYSSKPHTPAQQRTGAGGD
jgi:glutaminase